jgi:hypothetical protein
LDEGVVVLSGKVSKFYITFTLDIFPDSTPNSVSRVLRDRYPSKSGSVFKILPLVHYVPMIITSSLFIRFEHTSNGWKVLKVHYEFGITSFLR